MLKSDKKPVVKILSKKNKLENTIPKFFSKEISVTKTDLMLINITLYPDVPF